MSSGTLPLAKYHRAQALGSGTYGSVMTVYNDDGDEFALKIYDDEEEDSEEESDDESYYNSDDDEEYSYTSSTQNNVSGQTLELGTLREISILRILRSSNSHPNIVQIHDVKGKSTDEVDDEHGSGFVSDIDNYMGIAMPLFHRTLTSAIESKLISTKKDKIIIAHGLLSSIAFLHENGIIHRDIKPDNIMLETVTSGNSITFQPILIDFSLAKLFHPQNIYKDYDDIVTIMNNNAKKLMKNNKEKNKSRRNQNNKKVKQSKHNKKNDDNDSTYELTHTAEICTPTYRAPEVTEKKPYGLPSDMYSVGVVLLELLRGSTIEAYKDNTAFKIISDIIESLPDQPFPNLIRGLLQSDPSKRFTAKDALQHDVFQKFGLSSDHKVNEKDFPNLKDWQSYTFRSLDLAQALPFSIEQEEYTSSTLSPNENGSIKSALLEIDKNSILSKNHHTTETNATKSLTKPNKKTSSQIQKLTNRYKMIQKIASELESENPLTIQAALTYSIQFEDVEPDIDNLEETQALVDCVVLAHKFFELEMWSLSYLEEKDEKGVFQDCGWTVEQYLQNESSLFILMDFCLLPRKLFSFNL